MLINSDSGARLQSPGDVSLRSAPSSQEITDKLSGLFAGQRLLAEIQSVMPNGTYRALINQRSVTLALPFAARTGDAIELEVTASDGKLTLAVRAGNPAETAAAAPSAATRLSRTGQFIQDLFGNSHDGKAAAPALPLNGNRPISEQPPRSGQELSPLLQQAIRQSGMFYEAHQAEWIAGRFAQSELLQEPQARQRGQEKPVASRDTHALGSASQTRRGIQANPQQPQTTTVAASPTGGPLEAQDGVIPENGRPVESSEASSGRIVATKDMADTSPETSPGSTTIGGGDGRRPPAAPLPMAVSTADAPTSEKLPPSIDHAGSAVKDGVHDTAIVSSPRPSAPQDLRPPARTVSALSDTATNSPATDLQPSAEPSPALPEPSEPVSSSDGSPHRVQFAGQERPPSARALPEPAIHVFPDVETVQKSSGDAASTPTLAVHGEQAAAQIVPQSLQSIVQQQLEAFATQHFSWQGQIWPGQQMHWEIDDQSQERDADGEPRDGSEKWQTRLRLILPKLGEVDARLRIEDRQMTLTLLAESEQTRAMLRSQGGELRQQLENAGLTLAALGVVPPAD